MKRLLAISLVAIIGIAQGGAAFGASYGTLRMDLSVSGPTMDIIGSVYTGTTDADYDGTVLSADATAIGNGFGGLVGAGSIEMYCVELTQGIPDRTDVEFEIVDLQDLSQISFLEAVRLRKMVTVAGGIGGTNKAEEQAAAWEIVHGDGNLDLSGGANIQVTGFGGGATVAGAQALLNGINAGVAQASVFGLFNKVSQDWGVLVVGGGENVPEPAVIVNLLGLTVFGCVAFFRNRRKK